MMPEVTKLMIAKRRPGPEFYRASLLRNHNLVFDAFLSSLIIVIIIAVVVCFWGRMRIASDLWFAATIIWLLRLWRQVGRDYQLLHSLYREEEISDVPAGSPLNAALSAAANMTHWNLCAFSLIMIIMLLLFVEAMLGKV
jgi:hypothetical protein